MPMTSLTVPETCGVMLLPDCVLFPHGGLPLHIFEPRYRKMLEDAIAGDCLFAVARLTGEETADLRSCAARIGTLGLIRASRLADDGTSQMLLHGLIRVEFTAWLDDRPYPTAAIRPLACVFEPADQAEAATRVLRGAVEDATEGLPHDMRVAVLDITSRADEPALLTDIVAHQFVGDADIRQRLLDMNSAAARIPLLCEYLSRKRTDD